MSRTITDNVHKVDSDHRETFPSRALKMAQGAPRQGEHVTQSLSAETGRAQAESLDTWLCDPTEFTSPLCVFALLSIKRVQQQYICIRTKRRDTHKGPRMVPGTHKALQKCHLPRFRLFSLWLFTKVGEECVPSSQMTTSPILGSKCWR